MNYKPDEGTLIAYLYGELDATESEKVMEYLNQHPEELKTLQQLTDVRSAMKQIQDKEVIAPPIFGDVSARQVHFWQSGYFKTMMSIAASFILILVVARLIGPEITYSNGELTISFNDSKKSEQVAQPVQESLTPMEVQEMINSSLTKNNEVIAAGWEDNQTKMNQSIKTSFAANSNKIDELMKVTSQASQDQVRTFVPKQ